MSKSRIVRHEANIDLSSLAPDAMATGWRVPWGSIMAAQGGIYMRPLMTLTPSGDPHWVAIVILRGHLILLDTWALDRSNISLHTLVSMAMHTVKDGYHASIEGVRIQLPSQGSTHQCWSRLFVYMARLAALLTAQSNIDNLLSILSDTQVRTHSHPQLLVTCHAGGCKGAATTA